MPQDKKLTNGFGNGEPGGMSEQDLKVGYWLTINRAKMYKGLLIALVVFNVIFGGYSLISWGNYLIFGYSADQRLLTDLTKPLISPQLVQRYGAQPLTIDGVQVFPSQVKNDAVAIVTNPNSHWLAEVEYVFSVGGVAQPVRKGFLLPLETKPLMELGVKESGDAYMEFKQVKWTRIDPHKIKNVEDYMANRLGFTVSDFQYFSPGDLRLSYGQVSFKVTNDTVFSYWRGNFVALYKSGETAIGADYVALDNFRSGETRTVSISIDPQLAPGDLKLYPDINVFDGTVYSK
jgi:hypothetical protein